MDAHSSVGFEMVLVKQEDSLHEELEKEEAHLKVDQDSGRTNENFNLTTVTTRLQKKLGDGIFEDFLVNKDALPGVKIKAESTEILYDSPNAHHSFYKQDALMLEDILKSDPINSDSANDELMNNDPVKCNLSIHIKNENDLKPKELCIKVEKTELYEYNQPISIREGELGKSVFALNGSDIIQNSIDLKTGEDSEQKKCRNLRDSVEDKDGEPSNPINEVHVLTRNIESAETPGTSAELTVKNLFGCSMCNKDFSTISDVTAHLKLHINEKPLTCRVCGRKCASSSGLKVHEKSHITDVPFAYKVDNNTFLGMSDLTHYKSVDTEGKTFICSICRKQFLSASDLEVHKTIHNGDSLFTCDVCKITFSRLADLTSHVTAHIEGKGFRCSTCSQEFPTACDLAVHKTKHNGEVTFTCGVCKTSFFRWKDFADHKALHSNELDVAHHKALQSKELDVAHHKALQAKRKSFICDICNKRFDHAESLTVHKWIHNGEKSFVCDVCGKKFLLRTNLMLHERIHRYVKPSDASLKLQST